MPAPHPSLGQSLVAGNGLAVAFRRSRMVPADSPGATDSTSEATPLTSGAAKLVPERDDVVSASGVVAPELEIARKFVDALPPALPPGAAMSTRGPQFE